MLVNEARVYSVFISAKINWETFEVFVFERLQFFLVGIYQVFGSDFFLLESDTILNVTG